MDEIVDKQKWFYVCFTHHM